MTILHASALAAGFTQNSQPSTTTSLSGSQSSIPFSTGQVTWTPQAHRMATTNTFKEMVIGSPVSEFWFAFNQHTQVSIGHNDRLNWTCESIGGSMAFSLYSVNSVPELRRWNGSAWVTLAGQVSTRHNFGLSGGDAIATTITARFDIYVKLHATEGVIKVYRQNILILSFTGNTITNGVTAVDCVKVYNPQLIQTSISEFLWQTTSTLGVRIYVASVNAAGATNTFTSAAFGSVDEENAADATVDADFASSSTADQIFLVDVDALANTFYPVYGICVNARALFIAGAPERLNLVVRAGATVYHGADQSLVTSYAGRKEVWMTNPNTGLPWTSADIAALQIGVRSRT